jgi:hypothetical protein
MATAGIKARNRGNEKRGERILFILTRRRRKRRRTWCWILVSAGSGGEAARPAFGQD